MFMSRHDYKRFYKAPKIGGAEFARLPSNSEPLPHLPNRLTCEDIFTRAAAKTDNRKTVLLRI